MHKIMTCVNQKVAAREEPVHMIALALLARRNLNVLGDVGQAKSFAIGHLLFPPVGRETAQQRQSCAGALMTVRQYRAVL